MEEIENQEEINEVEEIVKTEDVLKFEEAKKAMSENLIPTAIMCYKEAIEINPEFYEAAYCLAEAYIAYEDYEDAVDAFAKTGEYNVKGIYDYVADISPKVGISVDEILEALPQDFETIKNYIEEDEDDTRKRVEEARQAAIEEDRNKQAELVQQEAGDPEVPVPIDTSPYLTNTIIPYFLSAVSFVVWGFGQLISGYVMNAIGFFASLGITYYLYSIAETLEYNIKNAYIFTGILGFDYNSNLWRTADEWVWPICFSSYCLFVFVCMFKSLFDSWYKTSKIFISGYVLEIRNEDVWVNFGFNHYIEVGDKFKIYKRTKYLKTCKGTGRVTEVKDNKCILEMRLNRDKNTNTLYEIKIGDVVRK